MARIPIAVLTALCRLDEWDRLEALPTSDEGLIPNSPAHRRLDEVVLVAATHEPQAAHFWVLGSIDSGKGEFGMDPCPVALECDHDVQQQVLAGDGDGIA